MNEVQQINCQLKSKMIFKMVLDLLLTIFITKGWRWLYQ